jgi:hypothetical protein
MARNRDLKDIQGGRSGVRQTPFECRQSWRASVRIYSPSHVHRFKWRAGYRDPAARLAGNPSAHPFLWAMSKIGKGIILSAPKNMKRITTGQN